MSKAKRATPREPPKPSPLQAAQQSPVAELNIMAAMLAEARRALTIQKYTDLDLKAAEDRGFSKGYQLAGQEIVKCMYAAICLTLHEQFGFGETRLLRALDDLNHRTWLCIEHQEITDQVYQEIGLRLNFDELSDRVTLKKGKRWRKPRKP